MYAVRWAKMAALYFVIGSGLGYAMGISGAHQYAPAHAHLNLLGWVSMALIAVLFRCFPALEQSKLAKWQFGIFQAGVLLFTASLAAVIAGMTIGATLIPFAATIMIVGVILTSVMLWLNVGQESQGAQKKVA